MDNRVSELRRQIRALRITMLEAEEMMREQIDHDEECSLVAEELLHMRAVMSEMIRERESLGDREPIVVNRFFIPRRQPEPSRSIKAGRTLKRRLLPLPE